MLSNWLASLNITHKTHGDKRSVDFSQACSPLPKYLTQKKPMARILPPVGPLTRAAEHRIDRANRPHRPPSCMRRSCWGVQRSMVVLRTKLRCTPRPRCRPHMARVELGGGNKFPNSVTLEKKGTLFGEDHFQWGRPF